MTTASPEPPDSRKTEGSDQPPQRHWLTSRKLWLASLFVAMGLIAVAIWLPSYSRWNAVRYISNHGGDVGFTRKNEWMTSRFGDLAQGYREVEWIYVERLTDETLAHAAVLDEATRFTCHNFRGTNSISDRGFDALSSMTNLRNLELKGESFSDGILTECFASCPALTDVSLARTGAARGALEALTRIDSVEYLVLGSLALRDEDFRNLDPLPELKHLYLVCDSASDVTADWIARSPSLEELSLYGSAITDEGVRRLAALQNLRSLSLNRCVRVTAAGVAHLVALPRLESLTLPADAITTESIESLRQMPSLQSVKVSGTDCDPALLEIVEENWPG